MKNGLFKRVLYPVALISMVLIVGCSSPPKREESAPMNPVVITEWQVPWEETRPRDPYVDQNNQVWFAGQNGDYLGVLNPESGAFKKYELPEGTGPHNLIVDTEGQVWFAGNRAAYIGKLNPETGKFKKYEMPDPEAADPHTLATSGSGVGDRPPCHGQIRVGVRQFQRRREVVASTCAFEVWEIS